jgi:hypothetical protein
MDCEKFDQHVIDALYGELDELTLAALRRHVESCTRCAASWASLKSAREMSTLPLEEPPDALEERIFVAERAALRSAPLHRKIMRAAAWAGSHAMRPQLAMAALFMFVIGSSLLLLRARPGTMGPVSVSEEGSPAAVPQAEREMPASPSPGKAGAQDKGRAAADSAPEPAAAAATASPEEAKPLGKNDLDRGISGGAPTDGTLADARDRLEREGCDAALPSLQALAEQTASPAVADEARREIEACAGKAKHAAKPAPAATSTASAQAPPPASSKP